MQVVRTVAEFREARRALAAPVGFFPTLGYMHEGHLSLVERARRECASVTASIFVNPTQFGPNEDFSRYPRDEARDLAMLERAGVDLVILPSVDEMYPDGGVTRVRVAGLSDVLEGERRPGHFEGVTTVVAKLFNIVQPDFAYFGQKDAQQLLIIERMVRDLLMPVTVVRCPTVREADGLACSSRNVYLTPDERVQAVALWEGLQAAAAACEAGERDADRLRAVCRTEIEARPLARIDYLSLADEQTLEEVQGGMHHPALMSLMVAFGNTHLIDNLTLRP
ncbi:MAG: pantoate--beta-alanine ligase [Dehalococcoidia bacterium]